MKHASQAALDALDPLLVELRSVATLTERGRGVFYRKGRAFLHFHEDLAGLFADIRDVAGRDFDRFDVTTLAGQEALLAAARARVV